MPVFHNRPRSRLARKPRRVQSQSSADPRRRYFANDAAPELTLTTKRSLRIDLRSRSESLMRTAGLKGVRGNRRARLSRCSAIGRDAGPLAGAAAEPAAPASLAASAAPVGPEIKPRGTGDLAPVAATRPYRPDVAQRRLPVAEERLGEGDPLPVR